MALYLIKYYLAILQSLSNKQEFRTRELVEILSNQFQLSEENKLELLPSGKQPIMDNRVGWAKTYLLKAGLLISEQRGFVKISDKGLEVLKKNPEKINIKFLEKFPEFIEFRSIKKETSNESIETTKEEINNATPTELIEEGFNSINASLAQELLKNLRSMDPYKFEEVVGKLLSTMGYGKSQITKKSGDGGIDGFVNQDKLGLDRILFQTKRYNEDNSVTAREIRDFVGTLDLNGVDKGIFITTSKFPKDTDEILRRTPKNIVLINGSKLAKLMIEYDVGVSTDKIFKIKQIDTDFFSSD
ncbi:MAG: restriction endonuclease [Lutibacter sp.]|nr:restriction endonuclease [Lutibacter sp.]